MPCGVRRFLWQNGVADTKPPHQGTCPGRIERLWTSYDRTIHVMKATHLLERPTISKLRPLPDHLKSHLRVVFIGINPGLRSAAVGHHYAGPSNRFWKLLYEARLVSRPLTYREDAQVLRWGIGLTNLADRPTSGSNELSAIDYARGRNELIDKITRFRPQTVALLGLTLYPRLYPDRKPVPRPVLGLQDDILGHSRVFLLPNPSGRNAGYSYGSMLEAFRQLAEWLDAHPAKGTGNPIRL